MSAPNTRSSNQPLNPGIPNVPRAGNFSVRNMLPAETPFSPLHTLADVSMQASQQTGFFAPHTLSAGNGWAPVPAQSRPRENNEQGHGIRALATQGFGMPGPLPASANQILHDHSQVPHLPPRAEALHSMHGVSRQLNAPEMAFSPLNYGGGTSVANFAMQGHENPLAALPGPQRSQLEMRATFFYNPAGPFAEGVSVDVRRQGEESAFATMNYTGRQQYHTREQLDRDQAAFGRHVRDALARPQFQPDPALGDGENAFRWFVHQPVRFQNAPNPWQHASTPLFPP